MSRRNQKRKDRHARESTERTERRGDGERDSPTAHGAPRFRSWPEAAEFNDEEVNHASSWGGIVARYPVTALVASFGVGLGIGILAVATLAQGRYRWPRSLEDWSANLGNLPTRIAEHLPEIPFRR